MTGRSVNTTCPWSGKAVAPDSLTEYQGRIVGFCNPQCRDKFDVAVQHFEQVTNEPDSMSRMKKGFVQLAQYNTWMNSNIYLAAAKLNEQDYRRDVGAFFKSVHGTLNHILVWDTTWLQRFHSNFPHLKKLQPVANIKSPVSNDEIMHDSLERLRTARVQMDRLIEGFINETQDTDYVRPFQYTMLSGQTFSKDFDGMIQHVFNHQTHHRGQLTTMLFSMNVDPGVTDLLARLPDANPI